MFYKLNLNNLDRDLLVSKQINLISTTSVTAARHRKKIESKFEIGKEPSNIEAAA